MNKVAFFIKRCIRLCHMIIVFFVSCHINNFFCNDRIFRIRLINPTIWRFDEAVLIDLCIGCQGVDQTDVRSLRSLDRAHSSVMGIMYVTHLESGAVSGKTSRSKCGKTSLMCQLSKRVVLIHKLRQLRRTEELFHRCRHRFDIDQ